MYSDIINTGIWGVGCSVCGGGWGVYTCVCVRKLMTRKLCVARMCNEIQWSHLKYNPYDMKSMLLSVLLVILHETFEQIDLRQICN